MISIEEHRALQQAGANAAAAGLSQFDCPLYKSSATPAATGETVELWNAKAEAWQLGHAIETAMRDR